MSFQELHNSLLSKLDSFVDMDNMDIYFFLDSIECLKKDLPITNYNDVKCLLLHNNIKCGATRCSYC